MTRPLRVLHVTTGSTIGGAERLLIDMIRLTSPAAARASICTLSRRGDLQRELAEHVDEALALDVASERDVPAALLRLTRHLRARRYDVVHTHLVHASALGLAAARLTGVPAAVMTRHYTVHVWRYGSPVDRALDRVSDRLAHRVFAVSAAVREALVHGEHVASDRVEVIANGIDVARVRALAAAAPAGGTSAFRLVSTATLHPTKGHATMLEALARVRAHGIETELVLVGDGPLRADLERRASELGVAAAVRFTGYLRDPYGVVKSADVYVQPSLAEGFGISVLEAMALERPVIATSAGGLAEIVDDDATGVLVPPGDVAALTAAIERLARDAAERRRLGTAGYESVRVRYDAATAAARYLSAYRAVLARRAARA